MLAPQVQTRDREHQRVKFRLVYVWLSEGNWCELLRPQLQQPLRLDLHGASLWRMDRLERRQTRTHWAEVLSIGRVARYQRGALTDPIRRSKRRQRIGGIAAIRRANRPTLGWRWWHIR
eukprot:6767873-Prymnesium_polylepis.3